MTSTATKAKIRLAVESDAPVLARLRYELRSSFHRELEDEAVFVARCAQWMEQRLRESSNWKCWIAEWQTMSVGDVWAQLVEKIPNPIAEPEHLVYLTNFYIREEYRSEGIGSMMLEAVLEWARSCNAEKVLLWPTERSKPFYARHGFSLADDIMSLRLNPK